MLNFFYIKTITLFILIILSSSVNGQNPEHNYKITYTVNLFDDEEIATLMVNNNCSVYLANNDKKKDTKKSTVDDDDANNVKITIDTNLFVYKSQKTILSNEYVLSERFLVIDSLENQSWEVTSETKQLLGFNAYKAIGNYRGRTYDVWFTPDIPINNGPWKFDNLPGLIIKVEDEAKEVFFDLVKIQPSADDYCSTYENKLSGKKDILTREEYESLWRKKLQALKKFVNSSMQEKDVSINTSFKVNLLEKNIFEYEN